MKQMYSIIFVVICSVFSIVLADDNAKFYEQVHASGVIGENESILLASDVYFYANKKGHSILSGGKSRKKGHIVFTENGFAVISWSRKNKAYEVLHSESYSELASFDVSGNSPMVRLVTQTKASGKFNSYELMDSRNAFTPNTNKTQQARKIIGAGIQGLNVTEVASAAEVAMNKQRMQELEERIQRLENANTSSDSVEQECDCKCAK